MAKEAKQKFELSEEQSKGLTGKARALATALAEIDKNHGKGAAMRYGDMTPIDVPKFHSGSVGLDNILGGGYARGRIIEIYGPEASGKTTLTLHAIAEMQKAGGVCAFIDAEHALDPKYARALGVDMDSVILSQPDHGEQALEIAETLISSGAVDLVIVDSVAALVPKAEIEGEMGDHHVGLQARLMSQALRKLAGVVHKSNTTLIFINQIRMKIGVMFGCFNYSTRVLLADGTTEKIGKIVNQKMPVEVLSFNAETGAVEPRKVVNWFDNGKADHFLQFVTEKCGGNGVSQFGVTSNHTIMTPQGEMAAGDLTVGDEVLICAEEWFTPLQRAVAVGSILGDGSLRRTGTHNTQLRIKHGKDQTVYAQWKASLFGELVGYSAYDDHGQWGFDVRASYDCTQWAKTLYSADGRQVTPDFLSLLSPLALAIWYMDDGSFGGYYEKWGDGKAEISVKSYSKPQQEMLAEAIGSLLGVENTPTVTNQGRLLFSGERTKALHTFIAPYVHPSMEHKLHPSLRGKFVSPEEQHNDKPRLSMVPGKILDIYVKPETQSMQKFDLEIEDNHTYLVDGVAVHNSPETTTGGNSLKFYASQRLDIRRIAAVKEGEVVVGNRTRVKVAKNKVAPPFRECEFEIRFGVGVDKSLEVVEAGTALKLVEKSGAWYSYEGERIGQGIRNACEYLKSHPDLLARLTAQVLAQYVQTGVVAAPGAKKSTMTTDGEIIEE